MNNLQAYCPMSLLNLGVRQLPLRHWGHKGVVGYPYCGINANGWATTIVALPAAGSISLLPIEASELKPFPY